MSKISNLDNNIDRGLFLPLMEDFYTIQGEGYFTGSSAYFLRIGGCDVGCHWCDVKESWNADIHPATDVNDIVRRVVENSNKSIVVVTGGEPLMWDMNFLTESLNSHSIKVHLETSGSYSLTGKWDWICLSPKKNQEPLQSIQDVANELKIIVHNKTDFRWAEKQRGLVNQDCKLYLQPEWSKREKMTPIIIDYVLNNPEWNISLQTHKYLDLP